MGNPATLSNVAAPLNRNQTRVFQQRELKDVESECGSHERNQNAFGANLEKSASTVSPEGHETEKSRDHEEGGHSKEMDDLNEVVNRERCIFRADEPDMASAEDVGGM